MFCFQKSKTGGGNGSSHTLEAKLEDVIDLDFSNSDVSLLLLDDTKLAEGKNINMPVATDAAGNPVKRESGSLQSSLLNSSNNASMLLMKSLLQENQFSHSHNSSMHSVGSTGASSSLPAGVLGSIGGSDGLKLHSCGVDPTTGSLTLFGQAGAGSGSGAVLNNSRLSAGVGRSSNTSTAAGVGGGAGDTPDAGGFDGGYEDNAYGGDEDNAYGGYDAFDQGDATDNGDSASANMRHSRPAAPLLDLSSEEELAELKVQQMLTLLDPHEEYATVNTNTNTVSKQPSHALRRGKPFKIPTLWRETIDRTSTGDSASSSSSSNSESVAPSLGSILSDQYLCRPKASGDAIETSTSAAEPDSWLHRRYLTPLRPHASMNPFDTKKLAFPAAMQDCYNAQKKAVLLKRLQQNRAAFSRRTARGGGGVLAALQSDDDVALNHLLSTGADAAAAGGLEHSYHHPVYDPAASGAGADNDGYDGGGDEMEGYWFRDELQNDDDMAAGGGALAAAAGVDGAASGAGMEIANRFEDEDEEEEWVLAQRVERALNSTLSGAVGATSYETLCRQHIANFNKDAEAYAQESQLARRVADWTAKLEPLLALEEQRMGGGEGGGEVNSPCDVGVYSSKVLTAVGQLSPDEPTPAEEDSEAAAPAAGDIAAMPTVVRVQFPELVSQVRSNDVADETLKSQNSAATTNTSVVDNVKASVGLTSVNDVSRLFMACLQLANLGEIVIIPAGYAAEQAAALVTTAVQLQGLQANQADMSQTLPPGANKAPKKKARGKRTREDIEEEEAALLLAQKCAAPSEATLELTAKLLRDFHENAAAGSSESAALAAGSAFSICRLAGAGTQRPKNLLQGGEEGIKPIARKTIGSIVAESAAPNVTAKAEVQSEAEVQPKTVSRARAATKRGATVSDEASTASAERGSTGRATRSTRSGRANL